MTLNELLDEVMDLIAYNSPDTPVVLHFEDFTGTSNVVSLDSLTWDIPSAEEEEE